MQYIYSTNTIYSRGPLKLRILKYTNACTLIAYIYFIPSIYLT